MQISKGKIDINGISFGTDTSIDEVMGNRNFRFYMNNNGPVNIFTSEHVNLAGYTFDVKIIFMDRRLYKIQLIPVNLEMKDPGYPDEKYQKKKKKVADSMSLR